MQFQHRWSFYLVSSFKHISCTCFNKALLKGILSWNDYISQSYASFTYLYLFSFSQKCFLSFASTLNPLILFFQNHIIFSQTFNISLGLFFSIIFFIETIIDIPHQPVPAPSQAFIILLSVFWFIFNSTFYYHNFFCQHPS